MLYLFKNIASHSVKIPGRDGKLVHFAAGEKKSLDSYFNKYVPKYLSVLREVKGSPIKVSSKTKIVRPVVDKNINNTKIAIVSRKAANASISIGNGRRMVPGRVVRKVVGRAGRLGKSATEFSKARISENSVAISNNIGVGILSFNRLKSLIPLIESIRKYTNLNKTTIFVSDESTDRAVWEWLSKQNDIVAFHNDRAGIAVNSNRLLRCLSRFKYKLLLNDDVEILKEGWDKFYFDVMDRTELHHFCYRQEGIYGAQRPKSKDIISVSEKPHGAVLALDDHAFAKVGYFDESFGVYGFEHVDFSDRIARSCHNNNNYLDYNGSDKFFKIHDDASSDPHKHNNYVMARKRYLEVRQDSNRTYIDTSNKSIVPSVTYVIPFRDLGRQGCIKTVVNNIKSQRYPNIQIVLAEQDFKSRMSDFQCVDHILVKSTNKDMHFCKSMAFNSGVSKSIFNKLILHDADMLVGSDYTKKISLLLDQYESAHIGNTVCYMEKETTDKIVSDQAIDRDSIHSDRVVNYYEGGSFGITKDAYIRIGGFCEAFIGYGCEDCEFYKRMVEGTKSYVVRSIDLFHLWHDRTSGWIERHDINKNIQSKMFREKPSFLRDRLRKELINKYKELS